MRRSRPAPFPLRLICFLPAAFHFVFALISNVKKAERFRVSWPLLVEAMH